MGVADHCEQRHVLRDAINRPARVKNFVSAMLGIRLREHQQFDISRIAFELVERGYEIVDFFIRQREAQLTVGDF